MTEISAAATPRPTASIGATLRKRAFSSATDTALTVLVFGILIWLAWSLFDWAILRAVWSAENVDQCGKGTRAGACSASILSINTGSQ